MEPTPTEPRKFRGRATATTDKWAVWVAAAPMDRTSRKTFGKFQWYSSGGIEYFVGTYRWKWVAKRVLKKSVHKAAKHAAKIDQHEAQQSLKVEESR